MNSILLRTHIFNKQPCDEHIPVKVQHTDNQAEGKPAHGHSPPINHKVKTHGSTPHRGNGHHGKSAWASVKDMLHLN